MESGIIKCNSPLNNGPAPWTANAAIRSLELWAREGTPAAPAPLLELADDGAAIRRDEMGNALGGLRTPYVDAPAASLSGQGQ